MILWIGVKGVSNSMIPMRFDTMDEAQAFGDKIKSHYMESKNKLFVAFEVAESYEDLDLVYEDKEDAARLEGQSISLDAIARG